jgi:excisionase family DNA binding protein
LPNPVQPQRPHRPPVERRAYHINDFCKAFSLHRDTVYQLIKEGKLPDVKIGGRRVIPVDAAEALLRPRNATTAL